ncbi:hypothetical protein GCM10010909_10730 [Acidocella aquatica]|uniref:Uncharacterized protein n=1 Tax=Acidocella aquatica TaxID=1922313 RepID=A0ABQ6A854_9PROT|nr:hypothetical protein [Acidocella aquatica]GLR66393.1 hypothetical protein GCM10010909_10730 [Acidocella aquatica]
MMTNRSLPGVGEIRGVNALFERAMLIGKQLADFIMASVALPRIEQAVDMTACDYRRVLFSPCATGAFQTSNPGMDYSKLPKSTRRLFNCT